MVKKNTPLEEFAGLVGLDPDNAASLFKTTASALLYSVGARSIAKQKSSVPSLIKKTAVQPPADLVAKLSLYVENKNRATLILRSAAQAFLNQADQAEATKDDLASLITLEVRRAAKLELPARRSGGGGGGGNPPGISYIAPRSGTHGGGGGWED